MWKTARAVWILKLPVQATALPPMQMDTKTNGLTWEIVEETIKQSKEAWLKFLDAMVQIYQRLLEPNYRPTPRALKR